MNIRQAGKHIKWILLIGLSFSTSFAFAVVLNENCVVNILNRTIQVSADGGWSMPNVPSEMGQVRARATCNINGQTVSGQSDYFTIVNNGITRVSDIVFDEAATAAVIPESLEYILKLDTTLSSVGETYQAVVIANYPDGSTENVTTSLKGINYSTTNPAIVIVSENGLVTAVSSGSILLTARKDGVIAVKRFIVQAGGDTDGDGLPDDFELANGLNPNDPIDAHEDQDNDGLSALDEFNLGTGINSADTDGDGILDGEEVIAGDDGFVTSPLNVDTDGDGLNDYVEILSGSSPTDASDTNFAGALESISVNPGNVTITFNAINSEESTQLRVTGLLIDGSTINLTRKSTGTTYSSSDISIVSFGLSDGEIFAGQAGVATITVTNNGYSVEVPVTVDTFTPVALSALSIPGYANNVEVSGDYAYIAASTAGLQVVDVSDRSNPQIVASLDTAGSANDIRIVSDIAYIADGNNGLVVIDISDPLNPGLMSTLDTAGHANDVVIRNNRAFIADGSAGLQLIDVSNPFAPVLLSTVNTLGSAIGVAVNDNLAVIADGTVGIQIVDISNSASPIIIGTIDTGDARDVALEGSYALIADYANSLTSIDLTAPETPVIRSTTTLNNGGRLVDIALSGGFAFSADIFFVNGVPITDISIPESLVSRQILDFSSMRDDNGTGIAVDSSYVYLTAAKGSDTRLYIGQFLSLNDNAGIAPEVTIVSPNEGDTVIEGSTLPINVKATDDVAVAGVNFYLDGDQVATDTSEPYQANILVPNDIAAFSVEAEAVDLAGNNSNAEVILNVMPDPLTAVSGQVVQLDGTPLAGLEVTCQGITAITEDNGEFTLSNLSTISGAILCVTSFIDNDGKFISGSVVMTPVLGGVTEFGQVVLNQIRTPVLNDNPIAFWDFDEEKGSEIAFDVTGNGHDFNYPNGTTLGVESFNNATTALQIPNDFTAVTVTGDQSDFNLTSAITIEYWMKYDGQTNWQELLGKGYDTAWAIKSGSPGFDIQYVNAGRITRGCGAQLQQWNHCVLTFDGQYHRIYNNGVLIEEIDLGSDSIISTPDSLHFGPHSSGGNWQTVHYPVDDIAIYDYALTGEQIKEHHFWGRNDLSDPESLTSLLVYADNADFDGLTKLGINVTSVSQGVYLLEGGLATFPALFYIEAVGVPADLLEPLSNYFDNSSKIEAVEKEAYIAYVSGADWHAGGGPTGIFTSPSIINIGTYIVYDPFVWPSNACCFYPPNWVLDVTNNYYIYNNDYNGTILRVGANGSEVRLVTTYAKETQQLKFYMNYGIARMIGLNYQQPLTIQISGGESRAMKNYVIPVSGTDIEPNP